MNENNQGTTEYHLGMLNSAVKSMQASLNSLAEIIQRSADEVSIVHRDVSVLSETVRLLPCDERLESCMRNIDTLRKLKEHENTLTESQRGRRWGIIGAITGGLIVGIVEIFLHILGVFQR